MGTGSFPGVRCCRVVTLTPHALLVQRSKTEYSYTSLRAFVACESVKPTYIHILGDIHVLYDRKTVTFPFLNFCIF